MEPKHSDFWKNFGAVPGPEIDLKMDQQMSQKRNQNKCKLLHMRRGVEMQILQGVAAGAGANQVS